MLLSSLLKVVVTSLCLGKDGAVPVELCLLCDLRTGGTVSLMGTLGRRGGRV